MTMKRDLQGRFVKEVPRTKTYEQYALATRSGLLHNDPDSPYSDNKKNSPAVILFTSKEMAEKSCCRWPTDEIVKVRVTVEEIKD